MSRLPASLLFIALAGCAGYAPVRLRPGSNVALPEKPSVVGAILDNIACEKTQQSRNDKRPPCANLRIDTLPPAVIPLAKPQSN